MPPPFDSWAAEPQFPNNQNPHPGLQSSVPQNKKPRHRHSPVQLAALNDLFDRNEHPPLEQRTALADRLGMETKTVNAWFQNKRASSKKRVRGSTAASYESLPINTAPAPHSSSAPQDFHRPHDIDDILDDDYLSFDTHHSRSASVVPPDYPSSFYAGHPDQAHFYTESDNMPRRMRMRTSSEQTDELKKLYSINPHPTTEQRQMLAASIGMRYQSITNWFQNQRSLAKKRKEGDPEPSLSLGSPKAEYPHETRQYSAFPPPSHPHPSLGLPPPSTHPSLTNGSLMRRSPSFSPSMEDRSPRRSSYRSTTPYGSHASASFNRPRRSRPEPYQLDALKELFSKTSTPTIEERSALALEVGMDVGKVTNWFRNLRQMARKRAKKSGSGDDEDDDSFLGRDPYSASVSRFGTPSFGSSSSSMNDDSVDADDYDVHLAHSDNGSEDDYQEAVTPSPATSPSPPPTTSVDNSRSPDYSSRFERLNLPYPVQLDKISEKQFSGIRVEDALLLLSFHHHIVH